MGILNSIWEREWAKPEARMLWESAMLTEDARRLILQAKDEIGNEARQYCISEPEFFAEEEEKSTWVTREVRERRRYWPLLRERLEERLPMPVVDSIDRDSERVLQRLHDPADRSDWRVTGLVVGQVQSGKTTNYSSLISKAADAGYRMIIVFSGILNDLRAQTQERLDEDFIGSHQFRFRSEGDKPAGRCGVGLLRDFNPKKAPNSGTWMDKDFEPQAAKAEELPWLFVIKKNTAVFRKLIEWLKNKVPDKRNWPLLVIDDEADQASINTRGSDDIVTATNRCIRQILELFPRAAFVGYTATPFANIFISSTAESRALGRDLFPRDFIARISPAANYFGARDFFGDPEEDGLDLFIPFDAAHADAWIVKDGRRTLVTDEVPAEAASCLRHFVLATAIRMWRGRTGWGDEDLSKPVLETSMLIHVTHLVRNQRKVAEQLHELIDELRGGFSYDSDEELRTYARMLEEQRAVTARLAENRKVRDLNLNRELPESIEALSDFIGHALEDLSLVILNGEVRRQTVAEPERGPGERPFAEARIFIGGNKLSRGLTLPGLCVSMFLRQTSMYDTLLQMGRWFGYRDGYVDLCRICTTPRIISNFQGIVEACEDLDVQLDQMNAANRTPENFRLKILHHPGLLITARNKMRTAAEAVVSFSGRTLEQRVLDLERDRIRENVRAAELLLDEAGRRGRLVYASARHEAPQNPEKPLLLEADGGSKLSGRLWRDVPAEAVLDFLASYSGLVGGAGVEQQGMRDYIRRMNEAGELTTWTVFVPGVQGPGRFGTGGVFRTMIGEGEESEQVALKTLKTGGHEFVGVSEDVMAASGIRGLPADAARGEGFRRVREEAGRLRPEEGHLILYLLQSREIRRNPALLSEDGSLLPMVSFYLWVPASGRACAATMAQFNSSVHDEEDEDGEEELDAEEDGGEVQE